MALSIPTHSPNTIEYDNFNQIIVSDSLIGKPTALHYSSQPSIAKALDIMSLNQPGFGGLLVRDAFCLYLCLSGINPKYILKFGKSKGRFSKYHFVDADLSEIKEIDLKLALVNNADLSEEYSVSLLLLQGIVACGNLLHKTNIIDLDEEDRLVKFVIYVVKLFAYLHKIITTSTSIVENSSNAQIVQKFKSFFQSSTFNFFITTVNKVAFQKLSVKCMSQIFDFMPSEWILLEEISLITNERRKNLLSNPKLHPNFSFHIALRSLYWYSIRPDKSSNQIFSKDFYDLKKIDGLILKKAGSIPLQAIFKIDDFLNTELPELGPEFQICKREMSKVKELLFKNPSMLLKQLFSKSKYLRQMLWIDYISVELKDYIAMLYLSNTYLTQCEGSYESTEIKEKLTLEKCERFQIISKSKKGEEGREISVLFFVNELKKLGLWDEKIYWEGNELETDIRNIIPLIKITANNLKNSNGPKSDQNKSNRKVSKQKKNNPPKKKYGNQNSTRKAKKKTSSPQVSIPPQKEATVEICPTEPRISFESEALVVPKSTDDPETKSKTKNKKKKIRRKNLRKNKNIQTVATLCVNPSSESPASSYTLNSPIRNDSAIDDLSPIGGGKPPRDFNHKKIKRFKKKYVKKKTPPEFVEESSPERPSILNLDDEIIYRSHEAAINPHDPFKYTRYDGGCCSYHFRIYDLEYFRTNHILVNGENYLLYKEDIFKMIAKADAIVFEGMKNEFGVLFLRCTHNGILEPERIYTMKGDSKDFAVISHEEALKYDVVNSDDLSFIPRSVLSQIANAIISRKSLQIIVFNGLVSLSQLFSTAGQIIANNREFFEEFANHNFTIIDTLYISERFSKDGISKGTKDLLIKRIFNYANLQKRSGLDVFLTWQLYESLINDFLFTNNFWIGNQFCPIEELKQYYGKLSNSRFIQQNANQ
jgi:hypothetical protein